MYKQLRPFFYNVFFICILFNNCNRTTPEQTEDKTKISVLPYQNGSGQIVIPKGEGGNDDLNKAFAACLHFASADLENFQNLYYTSYDPIKKVREYNKRKEIAKKFKRKKAYYESISKKNIDYELFKEFRINEKIVKKWEDGKFANKDNLGENQMFGVILQELSNTIRWYSKYELGEYLFGALKSICGINDKEKYNLKEIYQKMLDNSITEIPINLVSKNQKGEITINPMFILDLDHNDKNIGDRINKRLKQDKIDNPPKQLIISTKGTKDFNAERFTIKSENIFKGNTNNSYELKYVATEDGTFFVEPKNDNIYMSVPDDKTEEKSIKERTKALGKNQELLLFYERYNS
ncbi:MAG: hypothetical protein GY830_08460 [Bacteroidetes bacterium]|nr:hypothetical protein [Bacteroidota bacterium]